jgi:cbb3-type cytochrome oxidase cytochrome c subunit
VYAGTGGSNLNGPPLTSIGRKHLGIRFQIAHLRCPSCVLKGSPMPPFRSLGTRRLHQLAVFLEASKGIHR